MSTHGGERPGAGRKHRLTPAKREEVARLYHDRKTAYAAAQAHVRGPNIRERRAIDAQMRDLAKKHMAMPGDDLGGSLPEEDVIWTHKQVRPEMEKLQAKLDRIPNKSAATPRRAKGPRDRFLQEIAKEFKISERMVKSCINEFKNIF